MTMVRKIKMVITLDPKSILSLSLSYSLSSVDSINIYIYTKFGEQLSIKKNYLLLQKFYYEGIKLCIQIYKSDAI